MPRPGGTSDRGYGAEHKDRRAKLQKAIDRGEPVACWRCGHAIGTAPWDLGHDDHDRTLYQGPEHVRCNRRAGAIKGNKMRGRRGQLTTAKAPPLVAYTDPDW